MERKNIDILDLTKLILAFLIIALHTSFFPNILQPWVRVAVPLFFMITSFLFFTKQKSIDDPEEKTWALKQYMVRNIKLYAFWIVLNLPWIIYVRFIGHGDGSWFTEGVGRGIFNMIASLLFSSTFMASWFISAQLIAVLLIFFLGRKLNNLILLAGAALVYIAVVFSTAYLVRFPEDGSVTEFVMLYEGFFSSGANSFPVAIFWCTVGKVLAERKQVLPLYASVGGAVAGIALCVLEWKVFFLPSYATFAEAIGHSDCLFSLAVLCPFLMDLILRIKIHLHAPKLLRSVSTVLFASHGFVFSVVEKLLTPLGTGVRPLIFVAVSVLCVGLAFLLLKLEKKFKILRFAH